jgi:hypothetical protein
MLKRIAPRTAAAIAAALIWTLASAAGASAANQIIEDSSPPYTPESGWQAGTCKTDTPECNVETEDQFYERAAGNPPVGFTQFIIKHEPLLGLPGTEEPVASLKDVRVDLPVGLSVNPGATEAQCTTAQFEAGGETATECPASSEVGVSEITVAAAGVPAPPTPPATEVPVFNLVPKPGQPSRFGFKAVGSEIFLEAAVDGDGASRDWKGDYHEYFTIAVPKPPTGKILKNRLVFEGTAGDGTFITNPSTCHNPHTEAAFAQYYSTWLRADGYEPGYVDPSFPDGSELIESPLPGEARPKDCDTIPFEPSIGTDPNTALTDSPSGATVDVRLPHLLNEAKDEAHQDDSTLKTSKVTLPLGMGLNPSAAEGLQMCKDEEFGRGTSNPVACPAASRIGTVTVDSPAILDQDGGELLHGDIFLAQQRSRDPLSGDEYRIFADIVSDRYGLDIRLPEGRVSANPATGQLTTTFAETPQLPFRSLRLELDGGPRASLTSPPTCGPNETSGQFFPWSETVPVTDKSSFQLTSAPTGGGCAKTLGARPFAPAFAAATTDPHGGAFTNFVVNLVRQDGNQEVKGVSVDMPPGLTAKLAGVAYCPEASIAAAGANSGVVENAHPSCPPSSLVGTASIASGSGPTPSHITGRAFLAGPYAGAPLSLAIVTPATAGPFDLGSVVVRVALHVDPETAQIHAVSDAIPHVFGGALLDVRSIALAVDRNEFSLNPTNCSPMAVGATIRGGGAAPANPAAFSAVPAAVPFQVSGCDALGFKPKLFLRTYGGTRRTKHPRLRAVLVARRGDANIGRASVALPHALILDQANVANVCTRPQFAADACPQRSRYGYARAFTPLLDHPLEGPVYLRSSNNQLPDMVAKLKGQVEIDLDGRIDTFHGGIRTTFDRVPDVPVSKFMLTLPGGRHGLLVNSRNLCPKPKGDKHRHAGRHRPYASQRKRGKKRHGHGRRIRAIARFRGQNGKNANFRPKLRTPCGKHKHRRRGHRH